MAKKLDPKKEQQEWLQGILLDMLKDEENKYCADCQAKTPRWAAWNLGVFICIRCAGIHRNLGVHISKVRSVNLDSWTPEQVQSMRVMGNEKARKVYEHDLPDHFRRPTTDHQMEQFIRSKYEQKRYILKDFAYPHIDAKDLPRPNVLGQKKAPTAKFAHNASDHKPAHHSPSSAAPTANRSSGIANLLDLDAPAPASALPTTSAANHNSSSLIDDFDSLAIGGQTTAPPAAVTSAPSNDLDDMFGSFVSAPSSTPSVAAAPIQSAPQSSNQSNGKSAAEKNDLFGLNLGEPTSTAANDGEKKSTADILSLFSTAQPAPPLIAPGGFTAFGLQAATPSQSQPAQQASSQMNFANFGAANAGNAMTSSMPSLPASMSFDGFGLAVPAATPAMSQSQSGGMIGLGSMGGLDLSAMGTGVQTSNSNPAQFPNPFGQPSMVPTNFAGQIPLSSTSTIPTSPPAAYKIPNKSNAFADLSIGKVMNMNYMSGGKPKTESGGGSGMVAAQPQPQAIPATTAPSQQMNLDDLLGGF